jgi:hypothetical protein
VFNFVLALNGQGRISPTVPTTASSLSTFFTDLGHMLSVLADCLPTLFANFSHVLAVFADCFSAFSGNLLLLFPVH